MNVFVAWRLRLYIIQEHVETIFYCIYEKVHCSFDENTAFRM